MTSTAEAEQISQMCVGTVALWRGNLANCIR